MATTEALFNPHLEAVAGHFARALEAAAFDGALIPSGEPPMQFADDQPYPFKANPRYRQWVPEASPGCLLAVEPGRRPLLLFRQEADYWHMPPSIPDAPWTRAYDLRIVSDASEARAALPTGRRWALLGEPAPAWDGLGEANPAAVTAPLDYGRAAKTPYEVECLARASLAGARAHRAAERAWRDGASEFAIHLEYCRAAGAREEDLPYNSIVACNEHGAVLHYQHLDRQAPAARRSFLIDAGAPYAGYGSDITRTYAAGPGPFADLVAAVDGVQRRLASLVAPGRDYRDIHLEAHRLIGGVLADCGLSRVRDDDAVDAGVTRAFFPHGIGHLLGLQVHDVGGLMADDTGALRPRPEGHPFLRLTRDLAEGFVVTIEPGVYFIDLLLAAARADRRAALIDWDRVEALRPCGGVRIEDNVVALAGGPRNLTREAFAAT
ncbi:MAG: pepQ [Proteobacteria bacterium]|nr:pepQ [Pseudomonadota bacterium]